MNKRIIFTGGGSAGHVTPNLALIEKLLQENWDIIYIGSKNGIERDLITKEGIGYYPITTGKFRRYFSWQNFFDLFKIGYGVIQATILCFRLKPDVVFSKGGFVSFPVVVAAWICRIPVIIHESDLTIGLTNKLCFPLATKICVTFGDTIKQIKDSKKVVVTGTPIRKDLFAGDAVLGREICGFVSAKKIILVFGGSLGADRVNRIVRQLLPVILDKFQVVHICGKDLMDLSCHYQGYRQFEYLHENFSHILMAADLVIARAGANSIYELIAMRKPNILLPLDQGSSRGDQIANAKYCVDKGVSMAIFSEQLTPESLLEKIELIDHNSETMVDAIKSFEILPSVALISKIVAEVKIR